MTDFKLNVKLENCYGIKTLNHEFNFSKCHTFVIYSPNGVMKTSFANTFKDLANVNKPCDRIDDTLIPIYKIITSDQNVQIQPETICVIEPYNEKAFDSEGKVLTLLANEEVRKEYLDIYSELDKEKQSLIKTLKKVSKSNNCEAELISTFSTGKENIFDIFLKIIDDARKYSEKYDFKYNVIFDPQGKVKDFLNENKELFAQYCEKYNDLISHSDFFAKCGETVFGTTEAKSLSDSVKGNEFFSAGHGLNLKKYGNIDDNKRFNEIVDEEIQKIFKDKDLKTIFDKVEKKLSANLTLLEFKKLIEKNPALVVKLADYEQFRKDTWYSFLGQMINELDKLVALYKSKKPEIEAIIKKATEQRSKWEDAIQEFSDRFFNMPFTLSIENKSEAILNTQTPTISFKFKGKVIDRKKMIDVLSQGEKKAFYILNVIFEVKSRQISSTKTLFIIDDIADSFDYKNKYAIVEYLHDISRESNFYSIVMTHNFDLFRTLQSRVLVSHRWTNSLIAEKLADDIKLVNAGSRNVTDPFSVWKKGVHNNEKYLIACIPFVRNLIEYKDSENNDYRLLTHALHQKKADTVNNIKSTNDICINDLEPIFSNILSISAFTYSDKSKKVVDIIDNLIVDINNNLNSDSVALEDKIILAIGSRLKAERYMWSQVTKQDDIAENQTGLLFQRYKDEFSSDHKHKDKIRILENVNIMTPENIHLNSFMYEPILDMGIDELKHLYAEVEKLK